MSTILIIGATSAIAQAVGRRLATDGNRFVLVARDEERVSAVAADLLARGAAEASSVVMDANAMDQHVETIDAAFESLGGIDIALIAHGTLGDQAACEQSYDETARELQTNLLSAISLLTPLANRMEAAGRGVIAVVSSVAGDRGRQSNYVYGTTKGALSVFLQGLRNRLAAKGVHVLTVKPGFVDTPMTADVPKGPLFATPDAVAKDIVRAIEKRKNVLYTPWFWQFIMIIIRMIPEPVFKRLKL